MKKLLTSSVLLAGSAVAGLLVWRKIEKDREDDLWAEADRVAAEAERAPATRGTHAQRETAPSTASQH